MACCPYVSVFTCDLAASGWRVCRGLVLGANIFQNISVENTEAYQISVENTEAYQKCHAAIYRRRPLVLIYVVGKLSAFRGGDEYVA
jgi:hypothetical protein